MEDQEINPQEIKPTLFLPNTQDSTQETNPQETNPQETNPQETNFQETNPQEINPQETNPQETNFQEINPTLSLPNTQDSTQETNPQEINPPLSLSNTQDSTQEINSQEINPTLFLANTQDSTQEINQPLSITILYSSNVELSLEDYENLKRKCNFSQFDIYKSETKLDKIENNIEFKFYFYVYIKYQSRPKLKVDKTNVIYSPIYYRINIYNEIIFPIKIDLNKDYSNKTGFAYKLKKNCSEGTVALLETNNWEELKKKPFLFEKSNIKGHVKNILSIQTKEEFHEYIKNNDLAIHIDTIGTNLYNILLYSNYIEFPLEVSQYIFDLFSLSGKRANESRRLEETRERDSSEPTDSGETILKILETDIANSEELRVKDSSKKNDLEGENSEPLDDGGVSINKEILSKEEHSKGMSYKTIWKALELDTAGSSKTWNYIFNYENILKSKEIQKAFELLSAGKKESKGLTIVGKVLGKSSPSKEELEIAFNTVKIYDKYLKEKLMSDE